MDVVVVGSCMIDLMSYVSRFPKRGETLTASKFEIGFGGKGANQCIVGSRLGAKCTMVGKVGDDAFGTEYLENFKTNNISTKHVSVTKEASTGAAQIAVEESGQNSIIIAPGANLYLTKEDVINAEDLIKQARVVVCQFEIRIDVTLEALKLAKKYNVLTVVNPAPGNRDIDKEIYAYADYFCPNENEAELLTGHSVKSVVEAEAAANVLLSKGCHNVIITLGENGAVYLGRDNKFFHIPAKKTEVVDTTGAGDAFIGALAYYLACHPSLDIKATLKRAGEVATLSVEKFGTQTSYLNREHLPAKLFL